MRVYKALIIILILSIPYAAAQFINVPPEQAVYGDVFDDRLYDLEVVGNWSEVVVVGSTELNSSYEAMYISKVVNGHVSWARIWYGPYSHGGVGLDVEVVDPGLGGLSYLAIVGYIFNPPTSIEGVFLLLDENGNKLCDAIIRVNGYSELFLTGVDAIVYPTNITFYAVGYVDNASAIVRVTWLPIGGCRVNAVNIIHPPPGSSAMVLRDVESNSVNMPNTFVATGFLVRWAGVRQTYPVILLFDAQANPVSLYEYNLGVYARAWDIEVNSTGDFILGGNTIDTADNNLVAIALDSSFTPVCGVEVDIGVDERGRGVYQDQAGNIHLVGWSGAPASNPKGVYTILFPDCGWIASYEYSSTESWFWDVEADASNVSTLNYTSQVYIAGYVSTGFPNTLPSIPSTVNPLNISVMNYSLNMSSPGYMLNTGSLIPATPNVNTPTNSEGLIMHIASVQPVIPEFGSGLILLAASLAAAAAIAFKRRLSRGLQ